MSSQAKNLAGELRNVGGPLLPMERFTITRAAALLESQADCVTALRELIEAIDTVSGRALAPHKLEMLSEDAENRARDALDRLDAQEKLSASAAHGPRA